MMKVTSITCLLVFIASVANAYQIAGGELGAILTSCPACEKIMAKLQNSTDYGNLEELAPVMCLLSKDKAECIEGIIHGVQDIKKASPTQLCMMTHICQIESQIEQVVGCPTCMKGVVLAKHLVAKQTFVDDVHKFLNLLCTFSGDKCKVNLQIKWDATVQYLKLVNPAAFCTEAKICKKEEAALLEQALPTGPLACPMCEYIMKKAKKMVIGEKSDEEILASLTKICGLFKTHKDSCVKFIEGKVKPVLSKLRYNDATTLCQTMKMCDAPAFMAADKNQTDFCKLAIAEGEAIQEFFSNQQYVNNALNEIKQDCSVFGIFSSACTNFFSKIIQHVTKAVLSVDFEVFFKHLHIC